METLNLKDGKVTKIGIVVSSKDVKPFAKLIKKDKRFKDSGEVLFIGMDIYFRDKKHNKHSNKTKG